MAKPTEDVRWAETVAGVPAAEIVEPNSGQKDVGWATNQAPPAAYFNFWMNAVWKWVKWLRDSSLVLLDAAQTFTAKQTFNAGLATPSTPVAATDVLRLEDIAPGVQTITAAGLQGGTTWSADGTAGHEPRAWKTIDGLVHCRGRIIGSNGITMDTIIAYLPVGHRPSVKRCGVLGAFAVGDGFIEMYACEINPDGTIVTRQLAGNAVPSPTAALARLDLGNLHFAL